MNIFLMVEKILRKNLQNSKKILENLKMMEIRKVENLFFVWRNFEIFSRAYFEGNFFLQRNFSSNLAVTKFKKNLQTKKCGGKNLHKLREFEKFHKNLKKNLKFKKKSKI